MNGILSLSVGSLAGGLARYFMAGAVLRIWGSFPYGILAVNASGCFLVGLFNALSQGRVGLSEESRMLLMVGFCGAFTTFSALILETSELMKGGEMGKAGLNLAANLVLGFLLFRLGELAGRLAG